MIFSSWITEARIALIIALASAAFTLWQGYSAHVSARVAMNAQRRRQPTFEKTHVKNYADYGEWKLLTVIARNHAEVGLQIKEIRVASRAGAIARHADAYEPVEPQPIAYLVGQRRSDPAPRRLRDPIPEHRNLSWEQVLGPVGSKNKSGRNRDAASIHILAKHVDPHKDLVFDWIWSDGYKD